MRSLRLLDSTLDATLLPALGDGAPRPLVFLHEGLGSTGLWRGFPERVRAQCGNPTCLVYSRAGYGNSDLPKLPRPTSYMHHEATTVLPSVLAQTGIERPVLIGHSDGASIALLYAAVGHPVAGLVLIAPHVFVEPITLRAIAAARTAYESGTLRAKLDRHHRNVDASFRGWCEVWLSEEFRSWNIEDCLATIACPVFVVQGDIDPYGSDAHMRVIEDRVRAPVTSLMVPGAGHAPHLEAEAQTISAIVSFVSGLDEQPKETER